MCWKERNFWGKPLKSSETAHFGHVGSNLAKAIFKSFQSRAWMSHVGQTMGWNGHVEQGLLTQQPQTGSELIEQENTRWHRKSSVTVGVVPVEQLILPVDGKQQTLSQDRAHINYHVRSDFPFLVAFPHIHSNVTGFSTLSSACTAHTSHAI